MHVTEMIIYDLFLFSLLLVTKPTIIIMAASVNSSPTSLSEMFIFGARNFDSRHIIYGTKNRHRKLAPENGVDLQCRFLERVMSITKLLYRYTYIHTYIVFLHT